MPPKNPLFYATIGVFAAQVDDLEGMRISSDHRYRTLTTRDEDKDGVERGMNLGVYHPLADRLRAVTGGMKKLEESAIRNLESIMKDSEWAPWLKQATGVGPKQLARLLSATGDPYWHSVLDRPRKVGELWAYCGLHAVPVGADGKIITSEDGAVLGDVYYAAPRRKRGVQANWSEDARKRAWLIATSCVKQRSGTRYRDIYEGARAKYDEAEHKVTCIRCGPAGNPALAGSPLSNGHQHARGLRLVAKAVLKDLWLESRRHHGDEPEGGDITDYEARKAYEAERLVDTDTSLVAV
jgi:hypothetical protein